MENKEIEVEEKIETVEEKKVNEKTTKELTKLEKFFQFKTDNLSEEEKNQYSVVGLIISIAMLVLIFLGVLVGPIWTILLISLFIKIVSVGLKSEKRKLSILSIILFVISISIYIVAFFTVLVFQI